MPVEIKELVIKAVIAMDSDAEADAGKGGKASPGSLAGGGPDQQELIQACVEQVLKVLKKEKNR
jgi:hypothetical protein